MLDISGAISCLMSPASIFAAFANCSSSAATPAAFSNEAAVQLPRARNASSNLSSPALKTRCLVICASLTVGSRCMRASHANGSILPGATAGHTVTFEPRSSLLVGLRPLRGVNVACPSVAFSLPRKRCLSTVAGNGAAMASTASMQGTVRSCATSTSLSRACSFMTLSGIAKIGTPRGPFGCANWPLAVAAREPTAGGASLDVTCSNRLSVRSSETSPGAQSTVPSSATLLTS
mmetsp:Transcript_15607/g.35851  ORF Transcript_15607/g.35851 Transcript_15607/m.35851 type:complete len:234 (-) Transcript_15607:957-1658(-)